MLFSDTGSGWAWRPASLVVGLSLSISLATASIAQTGAAPATEDPAPAIDPEAARIVSLASAFLAAQDRMSFDWFVSFDEVIDGREKLTHLRSGHNLLSRGEGFYSLVEYGADTREYFFDRTVVAIVDVEENAYVSAPFEGTFEDLAERLATEYDLRLPVWQLMTVDAEAELLSAAESGVYVGTTRIAGREAHHLAFADYDGDWQLWISTDETRPEILMMVGTDPYAQGWPQFRAYFTGWDFDPEIPDGLFSFAPAGDMDRMTWPRPGEARPPALQGREE